MPDPMQVRWSESATNDLRGIARFTSRTRRRSEGRGKGHRGRGRLFQPVPLEGPEGRIDETRELVVS